MRCVLALGFFYGVHATPLVLSLSELVAGDIHGSISQSLVTYGQLHVTALTGLSQVLSDVQYSVEEHGMDIAAESSAPISSFSNAGQIASTKLRRTLETISSAFVDILSDVCGNSFDTGGGAIMNEYIQAAAVDEFKVSLNVSSTMDLVHGFFQLSIHSPEISSCRHFTWKYFGRCNMGKMSSICQAVGPGRTVDHENNISRVCIDAQTNRYFNDVHSNVHDWFCMG